MKKEQQKFAFDREMTSQKGAYHALLNSIELTEKSIQILLDQAYKLEDIVNYSNYSKSELENIVNKASAIIGALGAEHQLKQVHAQLRERKIELLETIY